MMRTLSESGRQNKAGRGTLPCPCCYTENIEIFHQILNVPVNSVLNIPTRDEALNFPRGDISLGLCNHCGFIFNTDFDPDLVSYCSDCEESQGYSPTFRSFAHSVAADLIETYDLHNKTIVEIGCGKGEFLKLLCQLGANTGIGFDPAYVAGRGNEPSGSRLTFIRDYYSERYSEYHGDVICCRMTLEHISETRKLVKTVRRSIGKRLGTIVFFQVPNMLRVLHDCAFEDIYYEHCSYFTPSSLERLFVGCGFDILDLRTVYDDQYICIEARPSSGETVSPFTNNNDLTMLRSYVKTFETTYSASKAYWESLLTTFRQGGRRAVIWGGGSKAVSFLSTLSDSWFIYCVVDINPHRQGTYMPGTGQQIISPDELRSYRPDAVLIMNPIYHEEISRTLYAMGLEPEIHVMGENGLA